MCGLGGGEAFRFRGSGGSVLGSLTIRLPRFRGTYFRGQRVSPQTSTQDGVVTKPTGFFQLTAPADLLRKLEHDYRRLTKTPADPYPAFDFFITAEHLLDWSYPGDEGKAKRNQLRAAHPLLRVVSHIANGAKHMVLDDSRHTSVSDTEATQSRYGDGAYGVGPYGAGHLVVTIDESMWKTLGVKMITTIGLADDLLAFWRRELAPTSQGDQSPVRPSNQPL